MVETDLGDDVHFLGAAKGLDSSEPLFIVMKTRARASLGLASPKRRRRRRCATNRTSYHLFMYGPHRVVFET